MPFTPIIGTDI